MKIYKRGTENGSIISYLEDTKPENEFQNLKQIGKVVPVS